MGHLLKTRRGELLLEELGDFGGDSSARGPVTVWAMPCETLTACLLVSAKIEKAEAAERNAEAGRFECKRRNKRGMRGEGAETDRLPHVPPSNIATVALSRLPLESGTTPSLLERSIAYIATYSFHPPSHAAAATVLSYPVGLEAGHSLCGI